MCSKKKGWRFKAVSSVPVDIGLDSLFQETPTVTPQKRIVQPGDAFENTEFQALV
jgi:hypothetical protein